MNPFIPHSRPHIDEREITAVVEALRAGHLSQGEEVARLEKDLSAMFDGAGLRQTDYAKAPASPTQRGEFRPGRSATQASPRRAEVVVVSSGTAALYLALAALGVARGKKVVIPSYTCPSLYAAVAHAGATPVCADTGENSVCITPATVKPLLDNAVGAIIVPHMFGFTADVEGISALGCPVIEDCAQSAGGRHADGTLLGTKGHVAVLSFYGTKLLPAGEGGACITRHKKLADKIRILRNCDERPLNPSAFNFKMGDMNAALARAKLKSLAAMNKRRAFLAQRYDVVFGQRSFRKKSAEPQAVCFRYLLELPLATRDKPRACHSQLVTSHALATRMVARGKGKDLNSFLKQAQAAGITCRRPVWEPLHYTLGGKCPRTERLQETLVSIPLYPNLSEDEAETICAILLKISSLS